MIFTKKKKEHKKRKRIPKHRIDIDTILNNTFVVLMIVISVTSLVLVQDYIGYVNYHQAKAGYITEVDVRHQDPALYWSGVVGLALRFPGFTSPQSLIATGNTIQVKNLFFDCFEPDISHEVYFSTASEGQIDWNSVVPANLSDIDTFLGVSAGHNMSGTSTFLQNISVNLGSNTINDVPATYLLQYNNSGSTNFPLGALTDGTYLIFVSTKHESFLEGYAPSSTLGFINYQVMLPTPLDTDVTYYTYTDPFDECPAGGEDEGDEGGFGNITGYVMDNITGDFLENATVYISFKTDVSDANGSYFINNIIPGDYMLVGMLEGYKNYVGNVTIIANTTIYYNISMEELAEELTGTGSGVATDVAAGEDDPGDKTKTKTADDTSIGPGIGPGIGPYLEEPLEPGIDHWVSIETLSKKIRLGNFFEDNIIVYSFRDTPAQVELKLSGNISEIGELNKDSLTIDPDSFDNFSIRVLGNELGTFIGSIDIDGDFNESIPVKVIVTDEDKLPVEALLMQLELLTLRPFAGDNFKFRVNLQNLLVEEQYNVSLDYYVRGVEAATKNYSLYVGNDTVELLTAFSLIKQFKIPDEWEKGDYAIIIDADYLDLTSQGITHFKLYEPLYMYSVFGVIKIWQLLAILGGLAFLILLAIIIKKRIEANKRFHVKVEYKLLPKKGPRSLYVGQIAETTNDTFFDMDKLTVHSIVAGSTGGGKTISAQVIIEECLLKDVAVVAFDPTAQWSGMLRKCEDDKMMQFYPRYHLTKKDSRAFNGNIKAITNPRQKIDIFEYMKPGEIQVFTLNTLKPHEIDIFVANTVRTVFSSNLQEYRGLRMMMIYDEVHRLLPKFGGSGEGFIQIERACREFRKWGIGVMLVSQVLADFVGQIKANINTEVQMKTRDEGDLNRIKDKFGASFVQELVKSPVGTGMVQNSAWNRGKPYYITFRPILHSVKRLTDEELANYNKYNDEVDDLKYSLDQLEQEGIDVFDLRLELKLSLDKIKTGSFNMVEIYLEGLKPRIQKHWDTLGKKPKKRELELVSEEDIKADLEKAKSEREEFEKANKKEGEEGEEKKKGLGFNDDVPPDKILNLTNGMLCINLSSLYDEVSAMKDVDYSKHVDETKSDFADWIGDAIGNDEWAKIADKIIDKDDFLKFLDAIRNDSVKDFKPAKPIDRSQLKADKEEEKKTEGGKKPLASSAEKKPSESVKPATKSSPQPKPAAPAATTPPSTKPEHAAKPATEGATDKKETEEEEVIEIPDFRRQVDKGNEFILPDGKKLNSLESLYHWINIASEEEFHEYVNNKKNDFASWISGTIHDDNLAFAISNITNRQELIDYLEQIKKNNGK